MKNIKNNKNNPQDLPSDPQWEEEWESDEFMQELQGLWDEQDSRVAEIVARPEAQPRGLNPRYSTPYRHILMVEYFLLALVGTGAGIYTALSFLNDADLFIHIAGLVLTFVNVLITLYSLYLFLALHLHHPARTGVVRMSRFMRRMHMEPHYAPRVDRPKSRIITVDFSHAVTTAFSSVRQVAAVSATVLVVLVAVSCSPIGDGHTMTQRDRVDRAAIIENIDAMISQL